MKEHHRGTEQIRGLCRRYRKAATLWECLRVLSRDDAIPSPDLQVKVSLDAAKKVEAEVDRTVVATFDDQHADNCLCVLCALLPEMKKAAEGGLNLNFLERATGLEPATSTLARSHSTN